MLASGHGTFGLMFTGKPLLFELQDQVFTSSRYVQYLYAANQAGGVCLKESSSFLFPKFSFIFMRISTKHRLLSLFGLGSYYSMTPPPHKH